MLKFKQEELQKVLGKNNRYKIFCQNSLSDLDAEFIVSKEKIKELLLSKSFTKYRLLEAIFFTLPKDQKKLFADYFLDSISKLPKIKGVRPGVSPRGQIKTILQKFYIAVFESADKKKLTKKVELLLNRFDLSGAAKVKLAEIINNPAKAEIIYKTVVNQKTKVKLLNYTSPALALTDKDIELRAKAKKELGLINNLPNYKGKIRKAFREVLQAVFPQGKLKKGKTCYFEIPPIRNKHYGDYKDRVIELTWAYPEKEGITDIDCNSIYFRLNANFCISNFTKCPELKMLSDIIDPSKYSLWAAHSAYHIFVFKKEDTDKVVHWIQTDGKDFFINLYPTVKISNKSKSSNNNYQK